MLGPATEPFATPLGDVAVALIAGNGVVYKPSPHAALAGERIARAGLPEGLLRIVHGHAAPGAALVLVVPYDAQLARAAAAMGRRPRLGDRLRALRTCAEPKVITWDRSRGRPFWWFPYDATLARAARAIGEIPRGCGSRGGRFWTLRRP